MSVRSRKISELKYLSNRGFNNLWIQLKNTFLLFENEQSGKALGLKPLAGDLFGESAIELLRNCDLENKYLLECLNNLNFYKNEKGQQFRVNYAALSVEEFGSVYEGLLEFKPAINKTNGKYEYTFAKGSERSKSGSHYTPDELVQPLIKHSLDYIIEDRLKEKDKEKALLSITVLDISCGSGHILLNAARRIAIELAKARSGEDQPNPSEYRKALKDVIKNCIYGVDKNPLAVELCKVALWLESHNPGEPLNFLDHKIKCGDSIVGLAHKEELEKGIPTEAFKTLPGDDKEVASELRKNNNSEIKARERKQIGIKFKEEIDKEIKNISGQLNEISSLPESTPDEVEIKKAKYLELNSDRDWYRLRILSDIQVAQFFIPKTIENKDKIITDSDYFEYLYNEKQLVGQRVAEAMSVSQKMKFFHWFLEFPEVFLKGGFDCVLSNPPFLGGRGSVDFWR
ncbi:MAG: N-6 DNA methylase [Ignavibacteria bacterium]|nr:N-6 DNA methylase [Ignavibacteria bacterium]